MYKVTITSEDGNSKEVSIGSKNTILDGLENAGIDAPHSCKAGLCTDCAAFIKAGRESVELEAAILDPDATEKGFVLTCSSRVVGEGVELLLGCADKMYDLHFGEFRADHESFQEKSDNKKGFFGGLDAALNLNTEA